MINNTIDPIPEWLIGGGATGELIRQKDWSQTPLGPIESWPQSLRTTVSICLASNFPINIIWGPERVQIYNDGYRPICGEKHPFSMGQDYKQCWFSAWDALRVPFENATAGKTDFLVNQRMFLDRNGYLEETFFTFSLSPIRDESGGIGGLFHPVNETTQEMIGERRLKVLRDLAGQTSEAKTVNMACQILGDTLAMHALDVPFFQLYLTVEQGKPNHLKACTGVKAYNDIDLTLSGEKSEIFLQAIQKKQVLTVPASEHIFGALSGGPYEEPPQTAILMPIILSGVEHPFGVMVAGVSPRRELDEAYHTFYLMLRESVTNALTNARAYEQERKRAEALAEIDRAKTAFFSNVSHEFRTPLTLMLGPLEQALGRQELPDELTEQLGTAFRNSQRLLKLVNSLLDFSRIEAGRVDAVYEPVDLAAYTAELASVFRSTVENSGLSLVIETGDIGQVYIDRQMWEKIVMNLISNAFKFTFEGQIKVSVRTLGEMAEVSVSDTGTGIPQDEIPRLFERFHRVSGARGRSFEGTGIGLSLVAELVKLHGGQVQVHSEIDRGSTFVVRIPLGKDHLPAEQIATRVSQVLSLPTNAYAQEASRWLATDDFISSADTETLTANVTEIAPVSEEAPLILLADDNADMRDYVCRLLEGQYRVITAIDGQAALEIATQMEVNLILTDVMMPRLDGLGLLKALREDARTQFIPVIILSARAGDEASGQGLALGADDYLIKPFSARELLARINSNLKLDKLRREAATALQESYLLLFNTIDQGFSIIDVTFEGDGKALDYQFLAINPAFEKHTGIVDATGKWMRQIAAQHEQYWFDIYGQVARTRQPERFEAQAVQLGRWFEVNAFPVGQSSENKVGLLFTDITARRNAEQQLMESESRYRQLAAELDVQVVARTNELEVLVKELRNSNQSLEQFAYAASHDLQEPLRKIKQFGSLLQGQISDDATTAKMYLDRMQTAAERMSTLITDLLTYSKISTEPTVFKAVDLRKVVQSTLNDLDLAIAESGAQITIGNLPLVLGEASQLAHLFGNLMSNAVKFHRQGVPPVISVASKLVASQDLPSGIYPGQKATSYHRVDITDNGIGFDEAYLDRIFKVFQRLHGRHQFPGTGVGLAICQRVALNHGGDISAQSTVGTGSTFQVYFPQTESSGSITETVVPDPA